MKLRERFCYQLWSDLNIAVKIESCVVVRLDVYIKHSGSKGVRKVGKATGISKFNLFGHGIHVLALQFKLSDCFQHDNKCTHTVKKSMHSETTDINDTLKYPRK